MGDPRRGPAALVSGIFFVAAGVAFLLDRLNVWNLRGRYVLPVLLIVLGIAVLVGGRSSAGKSS